MDLDPDWQPEWILIAKFPLHARSQTRAPAASPASSYQISSALEPSVSTTHELLPPRLYEKVRGYNHLYRDPNKGWG